MLVRNYIYPNQKHWNASQLNKEDKLDLTAYSEEASRAMIKWLYTDAAPSMKEDAMIELMHMAKQFDLVDLSRNGVLRRTTRVLY